MKLFRFSSLLCLFAAVAAHAAVSATDAARLGKDLTPLGGETNGNNMVLLLSRI